MRNLLDTIFSGNIPIAIISISIFLSAQLYYPQTYPMRTYSKDDGLNTNVVFDAVQDKNGVMWFATELGISQYDGSSWINFTQKDGLYKCEYIRLCVDSKNIIWALPLDCYKNISFFDGNKWKSIPNLPFASPKTAFTDIAVYNSNNLLQVIITTAYGIFSYANNKWDKIDNTNHQLTCDVFDVKLSGNKFYFATQNGLFTYSYKNGIESLNNYLPFSEKEIVAIDISRNPKVKLNDQPVCWILTKKKIGYLNLSTNQFTLAKETIEDKFLPRNKYCYIKYDGIHRIYYGNEIYKFVMDLHNKSTISLDMRNGFSSTGNSNILVDDEKNVWFTSARGIDKISNLFFTNYNGNFGYNEIEATTIREMSPGKLFIGHNNGYSVLSNNLFKYYSLLDRVIKGKPNNRITDAVKDKDGNIWFTAGYLGVGKLSPSGNLTWCNRDKSQIYSAITISKVGMILVGSKQYLYTIKNNSLVKLSNSYKFSSVIRKLFFNQDGYIYATDISGLFQFDHNGKFIKLFVDYPRSNSSYGITEFKGNLLVGKSDGLFSFKKDHFELFKLGNDTIKQKIFFIEKDRLENLWVGTDDGVYKWNGNKLRKYSKENGLLGRETNRSGFCEDSEGNIWIGTEKGISCYSPQYDNYNFPPKILDVSILDDVNGENISLKHNIDLKSSQNTFTLHFNAISYRSEENIRSRVMLVGYDKIHSEDINRNLVRYTNIPPGNYYFTIQVQNSNGDWSKVFRTAIININAPFYQRWWFIILCLIILGGFGRWIAEYFYHKRYSKRLEVDVKSRTAELKASEDKIQTIVENAPYLIMMIDRNLRINYLNKDVPPFSKKDSLDASFMDYFSKDEKDELTNKLNILFELQEPVYFEYNFKSKIGSEYWMECYINPIISENATHEAIGIFIDRTELKKSENEKTIVVNELKAAYELLQKSLSEKDILLNEVYHRVGNNLQVISSLLTLQSIYSGNKELSALFQETINRIKSMSLVHERVYQSSNLDSIKIKDYITRLTKFLVESYNVLHKIDLRLDLDETIIEVDKVISLGLIINELLSDLFKSALSTEYQDGKRLNIFITAKYTDNNFCMQILNPNPELNKTVVDYTENNTLGTRLIDLLCSQLNGSFSCEDDDGLKFMINFPIAEEINEK